MHKKMLLRGSALLYLAMALMAVGINGSEEPTSVRDSSYLRLMVIHPHYRPAEPFTYPGPSPPISMPPRHPEQYQGPSPHVSMPPRHPEPYQGPSPHVSMPPRHPEPYQGPSPHVNMMPSRHPEPYNFIPPHPHQTHYHQHQTSYDFSPIPKWCKNMWEREECGMKCWMLRKICRKMGRPEASSGSYQIERPDSEGSHSAPQPYHMLPFYPYRDPFHMKPAVAYSKAGLPNTYYAQPTWDPPRRIPGYPYYHRYSAGSSNSITNEIGLNPHFTYVDGSEKLTKPTTEAPENQVVSNNQQKNSTELTVKTTEAPTTAIPERAIAEAAKPVSVKGTYPVRVITRYTDLPEPPVTTLSPFMFDYDQQGQKGYYGDRIYMSAVMPVSHRQLPSDDSEYQDFDEILQR